MIRASITLLALLSLTSVCSAQSSAPPTFPKTFDRPTVARLIQTVDTNHNAAVLKAGFFVRQRRGSLPIAQGLALVEAQLKKEKPASRRWVMLQSLRAFGSLRHSAAGRDISVAVYGGIFDRTPLAIKSGASEDVLRALNDFVSSTTTTYLDSREPREDAGETLAKGLRAWWRLGSLGGAWEPNWAPALERMAYEEKPFVALVDAALKDATIAKNANFYRTASLALYSSNHRGDAKINERALALLDSARAKTPLANREDGARLLDARIDLLQSSGKKAEAVAVLRERITLTGSGRDRLALMLRANKDETAYAAALEALTKPDAKASEVLALAEELFAERSDYYDDEDDFAEEDADEKVPAESKAPPRKTPEEKATEKKTAEARADAAHADAARVLQSYLDAKRERTLWPELRARLMLGGYLQGQKKSDAARAVLDVSHLKTPARDADERETWDKIQALRKKLDTPSK